MATMKEKAALAALRRYVDAAADLEKAWDKLGPFDVLTEQAPEWFEAPGELAEDLARWRDDVAKQLGEPGGSGPVMYRIEISPDVASDVEEVLTKASECAFCSRDDAREAENLKKMRQLIRDAIRNGPEVP